MKRRILRAIVVFSLSGVCVSVSPAAFAGKAIPITVNSCSYTISGNPVAASATVDGVRTSTITKVRFTFGLYPSGTRTQAASVDAVIPTTSARSSSTWNVTGQVPDWGNVFSGQIKAIATVYAGRTVVDSQPVNCTIIP